MNTNQIIDALGGTAEVARMCNVTTGAVSQWRSSGSIPEARLMYLRLLRPDVFDSGQSSTVDRETTPIPDSERKAA